MFKRGIKVLVLYGISKDLKLTYCEDENKEFSLNSLSKQFTSVSSSGVDFNELSKSVYYNINNGVLGQIGYGFLMGYSSGFCLKKVYFNFLLFLLILTLPSLL